jgi:hypothetical protein
LLVCAPGGDHEYLYGHWVAQPDGHCGNAVRPTPTAAQASNAGPVTPKPTPVLIQAPQTLALTPNLTLTLALIADPRQVLFC